MIYADYNASAPLHPAAAEAIARLPVPVGNPHALHGAGQRAFALVEAAREELAALFGVTPSRIVFTSGATESNAIALRGGAWLCGAADHPSVTAWATARWPVTSAGQPVEGLVADTPFATLVANNETGIVLAAAPNVARLHLDATQALGRMQIPEWVWLAESVAFSGHKFGAAQGVGGLVLAPGVEGLGQRGGPQERGRRAGTLNVAGIVSLPAALAAHHAGEQQRVRALRDRFDAGVRQLRGASVIGDAQMRITNTSAVYVQGWEAADLVIALDLRGVAVSAGAACASGSPERSHVLTAMGIPGSALRCSFGWDTTPAMVDTLLSHLWDLGC